jgi:sugar phosphate isomerase/epimerase
MQQSPSPNQAKLDRIAVMSGSFAHDLKGTARPGNPQAAVDVLDLAAMIAGRYGLHRLEFQHTDFPATDAGYLQELRRRVRAANAHVNQINLEFANLNVSSPDPVILLETIDLTKRWIDYAAAINCPRVMLNQGDLAPATRQSTIESLKTINAYGKRKKVFVTMENRGGPWETVVEVIKASGIWANPDCGNFPDKAAQAAALPVMYRMTSGSSHIKHVPGKFDIADTIRIANETGYQGVFTIEASSRINPDPYVAVQTVLDLLLASL